MRVKIVFLPEFRKTPIVQDVNGITLEFKRDLATGHVRDVGVRIEGVTHYGVWEVGIAEAGD